MDKAKPLCETAFDKSVFMNGKKLSGVKTFGIVYDADMGLGIVTLSLVAKKRSVVISEDAIMFETPEFKNEP